MRIIGVKTPLFREKYSILDFIKKHIPRPTEGDIIVITSKIVALAEGRTATLADKEKIIKRESKKTIATPWALLSLTGDGWNINAGADESNADGNIIMLPKNIFKTAETIGAKLKKYYALKHLGVLITDTKSTPLRAGTVGRALGFSGFLPLKSYVGQKDLFGRKNRHTISNIADALAAAAVLIMGEGAERMPLAIIKEAPVKFTAKKISAENKNLHINPKNDIYTPIFLTIKKS